MQTFAAPHKQDATVRNTLGGKLTIDALLGEHKIMGFLWERLSHVNFLESDPTVCSQQFSAAGDTSVSRGKDSV